MPKVNERDIFEIKEWLNDTPQNVEEYEKMVGGSAPSGTIEISANGEYDVSEYATADVQVEGGGSSDFSTATVTVINNLQRLNAEVFNIFEGFMTNMAEIAPTIDVGQPSETILEVVLYKNYAEFYIDNESVSYSVSGNATTEDGTVFIAGDCQITLSHS